MIKQALQLFLDNIPLFINGIKTTLLLAFVGTLVGLILGFFICLLRNMTIKKHDSFLISSIKRLILAITKFYVDFVRGTPMMVQAVFLYYGLNKYIGWKPITAGLVIISLNTAAYLSEVLRAGILAIDKGQREGALALGLSESLTFRKIIFPQALRNSLPSIGNELIVNIKDSSVLNAIQVTETYYLAMSLAGRTYQYTQSMFILLIIYYLLTLGISFLIKRLELKLQKPKSIEVSL